MRIRPDVFRLRIFHFNDLHGRLVVLEGDATRPVFSRIASHVAAARAAAGRPDEAVLFFSGGDDLIGSPFAELAGTQPEEFRCHPAYRLYSAAGVDAGAIGNHDLDWGLGMLSLAAERDAAFPLVSGNIASTRPHPGIVPAVTLAVKGLRVGVIGLTTPAEIKHAIPGEFIVTDPLAAARDLAATMRPNCDALIVLSHLGYSLNDPRGIVAAAGDVELARALPAGTVDLILGAHTHHALNESRLEPVNRVNGIAIAQAGAFGRYLGEVTLEISEGSASVIDARLLPVEDLPDDARFEETRVRPLVEEVQTLMREPLGVAEAHPDLDAAAVSAAWAGHECATVNFVADALAARCRRAGISVDFALVDASVIAAGLPAGEVTLSDLYRLAPFADSIVTFRLARGQLQTLLDDNARRARLPEEPAEERGFAHFSKEVRYAIAGRRAEAATFRGEPLNGAADDTALLVACGSFARGIARAWERAAAAPGAPPFDLAAEGFQQTGLPLRKELAAYVKENGGLRESTGLRRDGRVRRKEMAARTADGQRL